MSPLHMTAAIFFPLLFQAVVPLEDEKKFDPNLGVAIDQTKVDAAIKKGVDFLFGKQKGDGSWPEVSYSHYGTTSLNLLALLKSGVDRKDPRIKKGFDYLRSTPILDPLSAGDRIWTYDAAVLIMALEALHEGKDIDSHTAVDKINVKGDDLSWIRRLHAYLIKTKYEYKDAGLAKPDNAKKDGDIVETGAIVTSKKVAWRYPATREDANDFGYDNSNTQYAILGLKSASRCGVKTSKDVWFGIINHALALQQEKGEEVARVGSDKSGGTFVSEFKDQARGWAYAGRPSDGYGSMTAGSIGSLIMARSELLNEKAYQEKYASAVDRSVRDGIAWIAKNWTLTENPKATADTLRPWHYYYLYALERVGMLAQVRNVGDHFWYKEGAEYLCSNQRGDGSWPPPDRFKGGMRGPVDAWDCVNTSFALLFLKRATMVVIGTGFQEEKKK